MNEWCVKDGKIIPTGSDELVLEQPKPDQNGQACKRKLGHSKSSDANVNETTSISTTQDQSKSSDAIHHVNRTSIKTRIKPDLDKTDESEPSKQIKQEPDSMEDNLGTSRHIYQHSDELPVNRIPGNIELKNICNNQTTSDTSTVRIKQEPIDPSDDFLSVAVGSSHSEASQFTDMVLQMSPRIHNKADKSPLVGVDTAAIKEQTNTKETATTSFNTRKRRDPNTASQKLDAIVKSLMTTASAVPIKRPRGRPRSSEAAKKRVLVKKNEGKINIWHQIHRWKEIKANIGLSSNTEVAKFLIDRHYEYQSIQHAMMTSTADSSCQGMTSTDNLLAPEVSDISSVDSDLGGYSKAAFISGVGESPDEPIDEPIANDQCQSIEEKRMPISDSLIDQR